MILSEDRQNHLAHVITDGIWKDDIVDFVDDDQALRAAKIAIQRYVKAAGDIDVKIKEKISSLKRGVVEGSPEWDVLYKKYLDEELNRRG